MNKRIKAPVLAVAAVFTLTGCDLLDVNNPNNLVEESIQLEAAANGVANGSLRLVGDAVSSVWEAPSVVADELYWTGSRDAWGQLDQGFIGDPLNEFTDGRFPALGQAVWMADQAIDIMQVHVDNNPGDEDFARDLARAQMFKGLIYMVTGEIQEDMTFSDKQVSNPPVGSAGMADVLDEGIAALGAAITGFNALGETELEMQARALRARAHMSRAIWDQLNPSATVGGALAFPAALADANAVLASAESGEFTFTYSSASATNTMGGNVNNRGENQWDESLVENDGPGADGRTGVVNLVDPVGGNPDAAVAAALVKWGDDQYSPLTVVNEALLRLIIAEDALANSDTGTFETQINAIRGLTAGYGGSTYTYSAADAVATLQHHRRVNTLFMGLRLQDMYRWGLTMPEWDSQSEAVTAPGEMLPITIVEIRANCHLNGQGCDG